MANHYITKEMTNRLYVMMKNKGVTTNQICKELNVAYPDFKAMLDGKALAIINGKKRFQML